MSSKKKKTWEKPTLTTFANAEDAIRYYSERGMQTQVAAIQRMSADFVTRRSGTDIPVPGKRPTK